ncbi:hypothetical protein B296_00009715 [Ensete ventricosum]|uniref:Uncharacterized protein n=1 Tax=Ensete ventricosum TaxID=4639 RepID=A0A427AFC5_ENSVE|nr:hypothetical protein B296_00009715 [Ensete ventricosum]
MEEPSRPLDLTNSEKLPRFGHPIAAGKVDDSSYPAAGPCAQHRARHKEERETTLNNAAANHQGTRRLNQPMVELSRDHELALEASCSCECGFREKGSGENCGKSTSVLSRNGRGWVVAVPLKETDHPPVIKGRSISPCHRASLVYSRVLVLGHLWVVGSFQTILPVVRRRENVIGRLRPGHDGPDSSSMRASYRMASPRDEERIRRESTILRDRSESDGEIHLGCRTSGRPTPAWVGLLWHPGVEE